jgi:hypothetical protein
VVAEDAVTSLRRMKEEGSAPMRTMASISLKKTLLRGRMVETLQLVTRKRLSLASQARYLARPAATRICATISSARRSLESKARSVGISGRRER